MQQNWLTLRGLLAARKSEPRRVKSDPRAQGADERYPYKVSVRLSRKTYHALMAWGVLCAPDWTRSEILRLLLDYMLLHSNNAPARMAYPPHDFNE